MRPLFIVQGFPLYCIAAKFCKDWEPKAFSGGENMDGQDSEDSKQSTADMTVFVQNLLLQMQSRFQTMSESIVSKIDDMGQRIDELEQSINELRNEMGTEGSPSPLPPTKAKLEDTKPEGGSP